MKNNLSGNQASMFGESRIVAVSDGLRNFANIIDCMAKEFHATVRVNRDMDENNLLGH